MTEPLTDAEMPNVMARLRAEVPAFDWELRDDGLRLRATIDALRWLVEEKNKATGCERVKLRQSPNCLAVHRFPCEPCRVLTLTEADWPGPVAKTGSEKGAG